MLFIAGTTIQTLIQIAGTLYIHHDFDYLDGRWDSISIFLVYKYPCAYHITMESGDSSQTVQ